MIDVKSSSKHRHIFFIIGVVITRVVVGFVIEVFAIPPHVVVDVVVDVASFDGTIDPIIQLIFLFYLFSYLLTVCLL